MQRHDLCSGTPGRLNGRFSWISRWRCPDRNRHRGFKSIKNDLVIYLDCGWYLYDYLQKETHEKGLFDVIIKPASALAWYWLFSQHGGNKGIPHTGREREQPQMSDWNQGKAVCGRFWCKVYLLGWCFLQQTSPVGLRVKPSHNSRLSFPNSSTPSVTLRPLTITTPILALTYNKKTRERDAQSFRGRLHTCRHNSLETRHGSDTDTPGFSWLIILITYLNHY